MQPVFICFLSFLRSALVTGVGSVDWSHKKSFGAFFES